jgi:hypothetical protein
MIGQMEKIITFSTEEHIFNVPEDDLTYFLFNCYGVTKLAPGQKVFVTSDSTIVGFKQSYPLRQIVPKRHVKKFGEDLLIDILAHYKRIEACDTFRYDSNLSDSIISYINKCNKVGTINSLVKRYIEEGKFYEEISSPIK